MNTEQRIREIRKGTLKWYPFKEGASILFVGDKTDPLFEMLEEMDLKVDCISAKDVYDNNKSYDYIIAIESLEVLKDVPGAITHLSKCLSKDGHMIIGFNNRLGVRYFFGDRDPYTKQNYDGIENYRRTYSKKEDKFLGKCYDKASIIDVLESVGFNHQNYSLFPDFSNTQLILRDDYRSKEDYSIRVLPTYNYANTVFLEEEYIYNSLQNNNMLHSMANCLLFDCTFSDEKLDILQVTSSMGRDKEDAFFTIIHEGDNHDGNMIVNKVPAYPEGYKKVDSMLSIAEDLKAHGLSIVDMKKDENGNLIMPYISAPTAQSYLRQVAFESEEKFLDKLDEFVSLIRKSSEEVSADENEEVPICQRAYHDLMPLNCFYVDGEFVFFDQEFYDENYPINAVICRAIDCTSEMITAAKLSISHDDLLRRYGLYEKRDKWRRMHWEFISKLRNEKELATYFTKKRYDGNQVYSNRLRMNFSSEEYLRRFVNIFQGIDNKKIILFGTGNFAVEFMNKYGKGYDIDVVVDNNKSRQGSDFFGVKVSSPDILEEYEDKTYRVIICIKNFLSVVNQLEEMGVTEYGIYDPSQIYIRPRKTSNVPLKGHNASSDNNQSKKYQTGYIAGVFDLFHVGHLEKFKLAKEQCEHLIVGLVSDEGVIKHKKTTPFVPFEERKAMLEACRYVDEVVKIPLDFAGTKDAWKMYGFDVQFSGSDYIDDPWWLAEKEFLEQHGVDMVFFPYTESTSSSKLKALIEEKLI